MDKKVLIAATLAAAAFSGPGSALAIRSSDEPAQGPFLPTYGRPGKGKGKRPHHSSSRFVAQDKRDARKARNRRRG